MGRRFPWLRGLGAAVLLALVCVELPAASPSRPNVVLVLVDDLGRSDLGVDGSNFYETPRLDAWARTAVRFTDFYSAHPVCSPTRAALLTGRAPQRLGITDWIHPGSGVALATSEVTLGEKFEAAGYQTAYLGKWHLGELDSDHPSQHGFAWSRGVNRAGQPASFFPPFRNSETRATVWDVPDFGSAQPGDYLTDLLTSSAISFLEARDPQRPFFLCLAHYAVHTPIQAPPDLVEKYRAKRRARFGDSPTPTVSAVPGAVSRARQDDPAYAAMVENLDTNVGRLLDALDRLKLRDNTLVVFTSDNGGLCTLEGKSPGPTCNLPWRSGKGWNYEGGIRVPFLISWPARWSARTVSLPASTTDLYPTLVEACGLSSNQNPPRDGHSLVRVLEGQSDPALEQRFLAWYYPHAHGSGHRPSAALREGRWKLILSLTDGRSELYDLKTDPGETRDQSTTYSEQERRLRSQLQTWIEATRVRSPGAESVPRDPASPRPQP